MVKIIFDAMGAEGGLEVAIKGAKKATKNLDENDKLILVGNDVLIEKCRQNDLESYFAPDIFSMDSNPKKEIRKEKESSIMVAMDLVREGAGDILYSPGNTGATVAAGVLKNNYLDRRIRSFPLATIVPTIIRDKYVVLLDVGASSVDLQKSIEQNIHTLYNFAIEGKAFYETMFDKNPKVGLINVGVESYKGPIEVNLCGKLLEKSDMNYVGFVEGDKILEGNCDVIVTHGFSGNVAIKSKKGVFKVIKYLFGKGIPDLKDMHKNIEVLKDTIELAKDKKIGSIFNNVRRTAGTYIAEPMGVFNFLKKRLNYDKYNGAYMMGIKKPVVVGHGSSSIEGIKNGILFAKKCYEKSSEINNKIITEIESEKNEKIIKDLYDETTFIKLKKSY